MATNPSKSPRRRTSAGRGLAVSVLAAALMQPLLAATPAAAAAPAVPTVVPGTAAAWTSTTTVTTTAAASRTRLPRRCRTAGKVICIDARRHKVRAVESGRVQFSFDARLGRRGYPTRRGTFRVYSKDADHVSRIYRVPMPYSMFFSRGQAIHYSRDFARHGYGVGSHGCVNLRTLSGARRLFDWAPLGTRVVVR